MDTNITTKRLNLGCGNTKQTGEIGVDIIKTDAADIVCNLDEYPLPFATDSIDEIYSNHCFEHINDLVALMTDLHRILKPGGTLDFTVPHISNIEYYRDPTHKTPFIYTTVDYFIKGMKPIEYTKADFEYIERTMRFSRGLRGKIGKLLFKLSSRKYEKYYTWKYPCYEINFKLRCIK